jgi:hypothetical protein
MAAPGIPQNLYVQSANRQLLISWDLSVGATSYDIQRSADNVTFSALASVSGSPLATQYLDTAVTVGVQYWYQVRATNIDGSSPYTNPIANTAVPTAESSLGQLRLAAQQSADRVNSNFVTLPEWNSFINLAAQELYDLLITLYEDDYLAAPIQFTTNGVSNQYPLPDGALTFADANNPSVSIVAQPFYKVLGVDLAIQNTPNGYVTVNKFQFIDRNRFIYPNTASTIYGVFNMQYRLMGNTLMFIPAPSANQIIRLWYIPRMTQLLSDSDITDIGISGWLRYVIVRAAIYALNKEESDVSVLMQELAYMKQRIEETAANRDAGLPDKISDARATNWYAGGGNGWNGSSGGF